VQTKRERLGRIVCGCELRQAPATGGRRHHHFTAVLRDLAGNIWECEHPHADQDEAHECARVEYAQRTASALEKSLKGVDVTAVARSSPQDPVLRSPKQVRV